MDEKEDLFSSESGEKEREEISEIKYSDNFQNAEITGNENAGKQKRSKTCARSFFGIPLPLLFIKK